MNNQEEAEWLEKNWWPVRLRTLQMRYQLSLQKKYDPEAFRIIHLRGGHPQSDYVPPARTYRVPMSKEFWDEVQYDMLAQDADRRTSVWGLM